jgi:2-dehydropantoate 2-reductase
MTGDCAVIPMLNGMAHMAALDARFGKAKVMGGTCAINAGLGPDGVIHHTGALQRLTFGERDGSKSERARTFADALGKTRIDWTLSDDIEQDLWEKIAFLSALAAACCLFRAGARDILAAPGGREALERALDTNIEIAKREGHPPRPAAIEFARGMLNPAGTWHASMLRDIERGGPVEGDHIVGWMLDRARAHGLDDTILSVAYTHLKAYEARRAAGRLPAHPAS